MRRLAPEYAMQPLRSRRTIAFLVVALVAQQACGDKAAAPDTTPASITLNSAANPAGTVATALVAKPSVTVLNAGGSPLSGIPVTFTVTAGAGTATGTDQVTNASGVATVGTWTLGNIAGVNTMTATVAGLPPVTVNATAAGGPATAVVFTTFPSPTSANNAPFPTQPVVALRDAFGNTASTFPATVTATISAGGGTLNGTTTGTVTNGVATFTDLSIRGTVGVRTLSVSATGLTATTVNITLTAGAATSLVVSAGNAQTATAGSAVATKPAVRANDIDGNAVSGVSVTFAVTGGGGGITAPTSSTGSDGVATIGSWTLGTTAGANSLSATATGLTGSPLAFSATGVAGAATKVAFAVSPSASAANRAALAQQPTLQLRDANNNNVAQAGTSISVAITAGSGTLNGTTSVNSNAQGAAAFTDLSIAGTIGTRTLTFSAAGITGGTATANVAVSAGAAVTIAINAGDAQTDTVGQTLPTTPSVLVTDADGNGVSGVDVAFAVASGGGSIIGGSATSNADGVAAATSWTLGTVAGANTATATATGLTGSPRTFTATGTADAMSQLAFTTQPGNATGGVAIPTFSVTTTDQHGNTTGSATIDLSITTNPTGGVLTGTTSAATVNGVATFNNAIINKAGNGYQLRACVSGACSTFTNSESFNVSAGAAARLEFLAQPSNSIRNGPFVNGPVTVQVVDAVGNIVTNAASNVTITIGENPGSATLSGVTTLTPSGGVATLGNDIRLDAAGSGYTLIAASGALTKDTSATFDIAAHGNAADIEFKVQPPTAIVGVAMSPAVEVAVVDQFGNTVTTGADATASITVAATGNPLARLAGTLTKAAVAGVALFDDVTVFDVNTGFKLSANAAPGSSTSDVFDATFDETLLATVNFPIDDMVASGSTLIFKDSLGIATMSTSGGAITRIANDTLAMTGLATDGASVWWMGTYGGGTIRFNRVAISGGAVDTIDTGGGLGAFAVSKLVLDATHVYYLASGGVRRMLKTATSFAEEALYSTSPSNTGGAVGALAIEAGGDLLYSAGSELRRAAAAGGATPTVLTSDITGSALTQIGTTLYYLNTFSCCDQAIRSVPAAGGASAEVIALSGSAGQLQNDGTNIWWPGTKFLVGSGTRLTFDYAPVGRLAFDATHVYWLRDLADRTEIYKAPKNP
jgi:hypothetical protein